MMTSEARSYWYALWDVSPKVVLRLYRQLVSDRVKLEDLYLRDKSGEPISDPQTGRPAYNDRNKWNRGEGVAHFTGVSNVLSGAMFFGAEATILRKDWDSGTPITDASQLIKCAQHGTYNRSSDPLISVMMADFVRGPKDLGSGVRLSLTNPIGIYIQEPAFRTFTLPANAPSGAKASDYWKVVRGRKRKPGEAYDLILHAVYEVPPEHGFTVSDILINGAPIEYGAQLTEVTQIVIAGDAMGQKQAPPSYPCVASASNPYPSVLRERKLLEVGERSQFTMKIEQGTKVQGVALKAKHSDKGATIRFVGAPGVTVSKKEYVQQDGNAESQLFILTLIADQDAPLGDRALLLTNSNGIAGPAWHVRSCRSRYARAITSPFASPPHAEF